MAHVVSRAGWLMAATAAGLLVLGLLAGTALAKGEVRDMVGTVVALESGSRTIVMEAPLGTRVLTVGAEVPEKASITAGKVAKSFSDLTVGDTIKMRWVREEDKLVIQSIATR
jgi:hypothetical protein